MNLINEILDDLNLVGQGKVREIYEIDDKLLLVSSDRISAFDVIMDQKIPGKGKVLNGISEFWFNKTKDIIPNHMISTDTSDFGSTAQKHKNYLEGRSMLVKKAKPLPVECVVRGYIAGSGWKEYQNTGTICGISLPDGLKKYQQLPEPVFTPSTKAEEGHDENIDFEQMTEIIGKERSEELKNISLKIYKFGHDYLNKRGIILADTKFEFGIYGDRIILIDEVMTPDSSRFWLKEHYEPGEEQHNFDKQILRDHLEEIGWNKQPPPPVLPDEIIEKTQSKYEEALRRIKE